jgi:hypothetical protein
MKEEQRKFIDEVILPQLVEMAVNDTLPLDMTQLSSFQFDDKAEQFNAENPQERRICFWTAIDVKTVVDWHNEDEDNADNQIEFTDGLADAVLDLVEDRFDANYGVTWEDLQKALNDLQNEK